MAQVNSIKILRETKQFYTNPSRKGYLPTHFMSNITHIPKPDKDMIRKENHKLVSLLKVSFKNSKLKLLSVQMVIHYA